MNRSVSNTSGDSLTPRFPMNQTLHEQRDLLEEVFTQVVEDFALSRAIREGRKTKLVSRQEVFKALREPACK